MKAAVCRTHGAPLRIEDIAIADPLPDEVAVDLKACAICHSDIAFIDGNWGGELPQVMGHEASGVVTKVGANVVGLSVGDRVCVTLIRSCGSCRACSRGSRSECAQPWDKEYSPLSGSGGERIVRGLKTGGFAQKTVVNPSQCAKIPDGVGFDVASLVSCGVITGAGAVVNTAKVKPGDYVAVIGTGGVGLNTVQMATIAGAAKVIAVDVSAEKLDAAREFGATHSVEAGPSASDEVKALTGGLGVDFAFVTVGAPVAYESAPAYLTKGGAMVLVGMPPVGVELPYAPLDLADGSYRFLGSSMGQTDVGRDIPWLFELYQQGRLKLDELITGRWSLDQINDALDDTRSGQARRNVIVFD